MVEGNMLARLKAFISGTLISVAAKAMMVRSMGYRIVSVCQ